VELERLSAQMQKPYIETQRGDRSSVPGVEIRGDRKGQNFWRNWGLQ